MVNFVHDVPGATQLINDAETFIENAKTGVRTIADHMETLKATTSGNATDMHQTAGVSFHDEANDANQKLDHVKGELEHARNMLTAHDSQ